MRGRTNVPMRKAPTINGVKANYYVDAGNTIQKGDFVSLKQISPTSENTFGDAHIYDSKVYDEQNGLFVFSADSGGSLKVVLGGVEDTLVIYDSYAVGSYTSDNLQSDSQKKSGYCYFCITSNKKVVCVVNSTFYCFSVNTTTKKFVLDYEETLATPSSFYYSTYGLNLRSICEVASGKFIAIGVGFLTSGSSKWYFGFLDFDFDETLTFGYYATVTPQAMDKAPIQGYNGDVLTVVATKKLNRYQVDFENKTVTLKYSLSVSSSNNLLNDSVAFYDNYVVFGDTGYNFLLYRYDASDIVQISAVLAGTSTRKAFFVSDTELVAVGINTNSSQSMGIGTFVKYVKNFSGASHESSVKVDSYANAYTYNIYGSKKGSKLVCGYKYFAILNVLNDELVLPLSETVVTEYDGYGSIGFANTSGNAGDIVQVYVPPTI